MRFVRLIAALSALLVASSLTIAWAAASIRSAACQARWPPLKMCGTVSRKRAKARAFK